MFDVTLVGRRVTVFHNGVCIHNQLDLGASPESGPILLQGDYGKVSYRNLKIKPLSPDYVAKAKVYVLSSKADDTTVTPLFPNLDRKKTWLMVKKDLEVAGIPYTIPEGTADFHAAGRHTYITELLRNGATVVEARELARHTDVRQTMKYAHIGLHDQAKALSGLPLPKVPKEVAGKNWQRSGSGTGVSPCQSTSSGVSEWDSEDEEGELKNPAIAGVLSLKCQPKSSFGTEFDKWRRRESNPRPATFP